jgi:hypothetical protein
MQLFQLMSMDSIPCCCTTSVESICPKVISNDGSNNKTKMFTFLSLNDEFMMP